ncbi:MAG: hypothetical protein HC892_20270 [Saprospiraceae bacterium]|nr:hypothetical protein [Saprospiraceae bacterium]
MKQQDDIQEELQTLAPFLAKLERKECDGFRVPEQYFEYASAEVLTKIKTIPQQAATGRVQTFANRNRFSFKWGNRDCRQFTYLVAAFLQFASPTRKRW